MTLVILVALFAIQKHGTASVGALFGPVMCVWFVDDRGAGRGSQIVAAIRAVLVALNPDLRVRVSVAATRWSAFLALGAVVLAVTGTEALYADMGHFGASPIRRAWLVLRDAGAGAQLFRPGRADPRRPGGDQESVLPAGAGSGRCCRWWCSRPARR